MLSWASYKRKFFYGRYNYHILKLWTKIPENKESPVGYKQLQNSSLNAYLLKVSFPQLLA